MAARRGYSLIANALLRIGRPKRRDAPTLLDKWRSATVRLVSGDRTIAWPQAWASPSGTDQLVAKPPQRRRSAISRSASARSTKGALAARTGSSKRRASALSP